MIKTLTLEDAISHVFGIDDVPKFTSSKPVKEAREWLKKQGKDFEYQRETPKVGGIVVFTYGAGKPLFGIVSTDKDELKGAQVIGVLSAVAKPEPKKVEKKEETVTESETAEEVVEDDAAEKTTTRKNTRRRSGRRSK